MRVHTTRRLMCGMGKSEFSLFVAFINLCVFVWVELKL